MNHTGRLLSGIAALVISIAAFPVQAAPSTQKQFYAVAPDFISSGNDVSIAITFYNPVDNPPSTINWIKVCVPTDVTNLTLVSQGTLGGEFTETVSAACPSGRSYTVTDFTGIRRGQSGTFTFLADVATTNPICKAEQWGAFARTGNSATGGDVFLPLPSPPMKLTSSVGCDGVLKCPSLGSTVPGIYSSQQAADGNTTKLTRFENKDLSACIPVGFNLDFQNSGKTVFIAWDEVLQPYAVLEADTDFPLELVDPLTGLPKRTQVAWELDTTTNQPKYIDAPSCLSSTQPAQYGTIATAITSASTVSIAIAAASLPNAPFSMIVASATGPERMLVQSYTGPVSGIFTASVVRGTGGTVPVNHAVGDKVASTPAPIINSGPYAGKQAEVCLIEENVLTQVFGTTGCPTQAANAEPLACVKVQSRFFIIGDPWLSRQ